MPKHTVHSLKKAKSENQRFATITAYDATLARIAEDAGIECLLVGDSLGNVIQGQRSTVPVSMEEMAYHTANVARSVNQAFVMSDLPFMSYTTPEDAINNSAELMQAGAQMVKLEGTNWLVDTVAFMSERGVPICGHLGLLPQSVDKSGGYRVQGKDKESADQMLENALCYEEAGADVLLLECVPSDLAQKITEAVKIPVIGIGAGPHTDSQVLVIYDLLGLSAKIPSFVKNYMEISGSVQEALEKYAEEVRSGVFPASEHCLA